MSCVANLSIYYDIMTLVARCTKRSMSSYVRKQVTNTDIAAKVRKNLFMNVKQSGAAEACWAHNPEVRGSKPRSAISIIFFLVYYTIRLNELLY
jgi:hypothetical protein